MGLAWKMRVALVFLTFCGAVISEPARLLKVPRIYNALITTDEELVPSQAYPAVAPVLRPAYHPLSYVVYGTGEGDLGGSIIQHNGPALQSQGQPEIARPSTPERGQETPPLYSLQAKERPPVFDDQVKNNRNPEIPDVPPPPLPVRDPGSSSGSERKPPPNYPPPPSAAIF